MLELTLRLLLSLGLVIGLLLMITKWGAKRQGMGGDALVQVVGKRALTRTTSVNVVMVGSRVLVLGTSEQGVEMLAELDPEELDLDDVAALDLELEGELEGDLDEPESVDDDDVSVDPETQGAESRPRATQPDLSPAMALLMDEDADLRLDVDGARPRLVLAPDRHIDDTLSIDAKERAFLEAKAQIEALLAARAAEAAGLDGDTADDETDADVEYEADEDLSLADEVESLPDTQSVDVEPVDDAAMVDDEPVAEFVPSEVFAKIETAPPTVWPMIGAPRTPDAPAVSPSHRIAPRPSSWTPPADVDLPESIVSDEGLPQATPVERSVLGLPLASTPSRVPTVRVRGEVSSDSSTMADSTDRVTSDAKPAKKRTPKKSTAKKSTATGGGPGRKVSARRRTAAPMAGGADSRLDGSILSANTWRQAWNATRRRSA